ncbi:unnamed protein product [Meganyctiphanes norvegica]|uniref:Gag protein n=1 Tax=Meganyctiphanes norvegica TaxID=48144 RepID=A0AAV2RDV4_MEGNR
MSDSDREDQQESYSFLGFGDLFITLAQEHEDNIIQAFRRYSVLQDIDDPGQDNQCIVSSTPLVTPTGTPARTPHVTPIKVPNESPRSSLRTEIFQTGNLDGKKSEPSLTSEISLTINTLAVKAASSLPDIHPSGKTTTNITAMSYQYFDRSLRMYNKLEKEVKKSVVDLETAIQNDRGKYEVRKLIDIIEVDREALKEAGDKVSDYEFSNINPTFQEEEWQTSWSKVDKRARAIVKTGKEYCLDKVGNAAPTANPGVKYEKLQVEPFEEDPMVWSFWQENAKKVISGLGLTEQRFWLKQKIRGDAKDFIGQYDLENLDIEGIFDRLNRRFGQPHMKVKKVALANKNMVILDESASMADIDKFWNKYMNIAGECAGLRLTAQSLTIILAMLHLPPRFRERLESKMREFKEDYKFTRADTMTPYSLVREEMLSLYPEQNQKHSFVASPVMASSPGDIISGESGYTTAGIQQNQNRPSWGENRGRVQPRQLKCTYCNGSHEARYCQQYDTPEKRRDRLVAVDRCRACMMLLTIHQDECNPNAYCSYHPRERHFWHLCDGPQFTHPGRQTAPSEQA